MEPYRVVVQRLSPLMTLSGRSFEDAVEGELGARFRSVHFAVKYGQAHDRPANNMEVLSDVNFAADITATQQRFPCIRRP